MKLSIGTAQIGSSYGVANSSKEYSQEAVNALIQSCRLHEIFMLDTAINYGESERKLGLAKIDGFNIITKLPSIPKNTLDVNIWIKTQVLSSLTKLNINSLYGVLLHDPSQLLTRYGADIIHSLQNLQRDGYVKKIGISVYSPEEIDKLFAFDTFNIIQAPFNIIDRRLHSSGAMKRLCDHGVEIHARSIFLQGLLAMNPAQRPEYFLKWSELFSVWDKWINANNYNPVEVCMSYIKEFPEINYCVVGIDNIKQLNNLAKIFFNKTTFNFPEISSQDIDLVNPGNWKI